MRYANFLSKELGLGFVLCLASFVAVIHSVAYFIYNLDLPFYENDAILTYQFKKLSHFSGNLDTIIVGDSSAGNAVDAEYFSVLSGQPTISLALTGSYGFVGSLNMIKQARKLHPEVKNVIIIQTLDIWDRPFSREGFFKTEKGISTGDIQTFFSTSKWIDRIMYRTDLKQIYRFASYMMGKRAGVVLENDFYRNSGEIKTYQNGKLLMPASSALSDTIDSTKVDMFSILDNYCGEAGLNCVFVSGPIHETILRNSSTQKLDRIFDILSSAHAIHTEKTLFPISNEFMGDSADHIAVSYKKEMTEKYFNIVKKYLIKTP